LGFNISRHSARGKKKGRGFKPSVLSTLQSLDFEKSCESPLGKGKIGKHMSSESARKRRKYAKDLDGKFWRKVWWKFED
jgi:hypothetical protein